MQEHVLIFDPNGLVHGLYTEALSLGQLGPMEMKRASHVEFDLENQKWEVKDAQTGVLLYSHESRERALEWERMYFNQLIGSGLKFWDVLTLQSRDDREILAAPECLHPAYRQVR